MDARWPGSTRWIVRWSLVNSRMLLIGAAILATVIAVPAFLLWLFVIEGPGSLMFPMQGG